MKEENGPTPSSDTMNGHSELGNLTLDSQGQGQDFDQPDSKYEFDPVSSAGSSSAPLSAPTEEDDDDTSGMLVDFDSVDRQLHEASTASVSPQSPGSNFTPDSFLQENKENADPMASSIIGDDNNAMSASFYGELPDSSQICDSETGGVTGDVVASSMAPGAPMSEAALQEIGVYGAPPPEETGDLIGIPNTNLVCLDEDGMEMPTTQAPSAPPNNPFSDSLISTQAPMGQFDPFKAGVNGTQAGNPFDSIPGQPPIGFTPPLQPREAFTEPAAPPLVPSTAQAPSAPGGPQAQPPPSMQAPLAPVQAEISPRPSMPPKNEPLFIPQPLPDVANVKATGGRSGDALLLEDIQTENGPAPTGQVVPPLDLSSFETPAKPAAPAQKSSPKKPASAATKAPPGEQKKNTPSAAPAADPSKIPSPKRAKPTAEKKVAAPAKAPAAAEKKANAAAPAKPAANATATTNNNKAPARKVPAAPAAKAAPSKSPRAPTEPKQASPRVPAGQKQASSPRAPAEQKQASPRTPASKPSPRQPAKPSPRATKGSYHCYILSNVSFCNATPSCGLIG